MTKNLQELKELLRDAIDEARLTPLWDEDRDALIAWLRKEAELLAFGPDPEPPAGPPEGPWRDIGYR